MSSSDVPFDVDSLARALGGTGGVGGVGGAGAASEVAPAGRGPPPTDAISVGKSLGHITEQSMLRQDLEAMMHRIDSQKMRALQKQGYLCSAECCDKDGSTGRTLSVVSRCSMPVERANSIFQSELNRFNRGFKGAKWTVKIWPWMSKEGQLKEM